MSKSLFKEKLLYPILALILTPPATAIGSWLKTGDWTKWFTDIPLWLWILLAIGFVFLAVLMLVRRRRKQIQDSEVVSPIVIVRNPAFGWMPVGELFFRNVKWQIIAPRPAPWNFSWEVRNVSPSDIEVYTPPKCPKCGTEIEEEKGFWGGYIWKCVRCDFKMKNHHSYYGEADRAEKIARRDWEMAMRNSYQKRDNKLD